MEVDKFEGDLLKLTKEFSEYSTIFKTTRSEVGLITDFGKTKEDPNKVFVIRCTNSNTQEAICKLVGEPIHGTHIVLFRGIFTVTNPNDGLNPTRRLLKGNLSEECAVCLEHIGAKSACCSQCGENICINCVEKLEEKTGNQWKCPLCRTITVSKNLEYVSEENNK